MSNLSINRRKSPQSGRVSSFSIPDDDSVGHENVQLLRKYCKRTGISFSYLVLKGISHIIQELGLYDKDKTKT